MNAWPVMVWTIGPRERRCLPCRGFLGRAPHTNVEAVVGDAATIAVVGQSEVHDG